jgi:hypothetical protein
MVANCLRRQGLSADGTFTVLYYQSAAVVTGGFSYQRIDNQEEGEVDPWVFYTPGFPNVASTLWNPTRTGQGATGTGLHGGSIWNLYGWSPIADTRRAFVGTKARGTGVSEAQGVGFAGSLVAWYLENSAAQTSPTAITQIGWTHTTIPEKVASAQAANRRMLEPIWLCKVADFRKGTLRWMFASAAQGTVALDTWGDKSYVVAATGSTNSTGIPSVLGPWDGKTTPTT